MNQLYNIDDIVFYMNENKIHSAPVLSVSIVQTNLALHPGTPEQINAFRPFGESGILYATIHGIHEQEDLYCSKDELIQSL